MGKYSTDGESASRVTWGMLEGFARRQIQGWVQDLIEEEVTELLGREKSERRAGVDAERGYRNGFGKTRRLSLMAGTVEVRRPRARGLEGRFESQIPPLFKRRTEAAVLFPKEHWKHLRTTNGVELPFAVARLRTTAAKRHKKVENATAVLWKTLRIAEKRFRKLDAPEGDPRAASPYRPPPRHPDSVRCRSICRARYSRPLMRIWTP